MDVGSLIPAGLQPNRLNLANVTAGYNKISENLRKLAPSAMQCAIFCGGSRCKYENSKAWAPVHMAIQDIYSHWVTEDVLAMARPSTEQIVKRKIVAQFQAWGIKTIINLQTPGEHASCGGPLEDSGFSYDPNVFMAHEIYYYNFAWKDYGDATLGKLLDMVKVVAFAVQEGKVAIHCHAGLGRTGVLIACYLVYSLRVRANDAIRFVRLKRPNAVQTRGQILCVQEFEHYVLPQMMVFAPRDISTGNRSSSKAPCGLRSYLKKQCNILHGYDQRTFKHIPKIVFVICERILQLCDCQDDNSPSEIEFLVSSVPFTQKFLYNRIEKMRTDGGSMQHSCSWADSLADTSFDGSGSTVCGEDSNRDTSEDVSAISCSSPDAPSCVSEYSVLDDNFIDDVLGDGIRDQHLYENGCYKELQSQLDLKAAVRSEIRDFVGTDEAAQALLFDYQLLPVSRITRILEYQIDLNNRQTAWQRLELETDLHVLSALLYDWLENLKYPVLDKDDLSLIVVWGSNVEKCLEKLDICDGYLMEYLLRFILRLRPLSLEGQTLLIKRLMAALTQQAVRINQTLLPSGTEFDKLRGGTCGKLNDFLVGMMSFIMEINTVDIDRSVSSFCWSTTNLPQENDQEEDNEDVVQSA
ncbi:protein tyrosine phosphatase domain-containing protein 1-like [Diprion similis]|uniref:protein tyrosine phosphatase domain-containing protein 1-like n=1 Tax=Diprion similis TaxID=362088 RepID=UPI001EF91177|nr:protein tyrosine phosphatase domain-containing protein 1-like [Diprion similis]